MLSNKVTWLKFFFFLILCLFPRTAVIGTYKLGDLRQQNVFLKFWRLKLWNQGVSRQGHALCEGSRRGSFLVSSCLLLVSGNAWCPLACRRIQSLPLSSFHCLVVFSVIFFFLWLNFPLFIRTPVIEFGLVLTWYSVQFNHSVVSDSLRRREPQHARPPCLSSTPWVHPNPCPLSWWCHLTISSFVIPFSFCLQSFPTSGSLQMSQLFTWWPKHVIASC